VHGDLPAAAEIDAWAAAGASATFTGHTLASVINGTSTYDATGDLRMGWDFGTRTGDLTISNFDGNRQFSAGLTQVPGPNGVGHLNQFGGTLSNSNQSLNGNVSGSFARGPNGPAQGVVGNWNVSGEGYRATGVFAGTQTSPATN
jgi:hypothetical protein